jgi:peroxiredoxin
MRLEKIGILAALALPLTGMAQKGYVLKGSVSDVKVPAKVFLTYKVNGERKIDSTILQDGKFTFKGAVNGTKEAHLVLKHSEEQENPTTRPVQDILPFLIENRVITIAAKDSMKNAAIKGSPVNDDNKQVNAMLKPYYEKYDDLNREYRSQPKEKQHDSAYLASLDQRANEVQAEIIKAKMKFVNANPGKFMALMAFNSTLPPEFDAIEAEKNFNKLDVAVRQTDLGMEVAEKIAKVKKTQEGAVAMDFTQADVNGKPVKLSDFRGKYVLLDFWASWCAPCRRENPNLVKAYNEYKDKGFTILGVSLDKPEDKEKWLKAIEKDGLTWTQVSDLKAWENEAAKLYEVNAIPMNFLIDPQGKIVAKYLRGAALEETLQKLLSK